MTTLLRKIDTRGTATLTLNQPQRHNAFDDALIAELIAALEEIDRNASVRVLVLRAEGKHFCAGADLNWMQRMADFDEDQNRADAMQLASLMQHLNQLSKPVIAVLQGATYGGGVGLVACCDIALASEDAVFCLSEVKLGLVPATIAPYVVAAIGARACRRYMLSAENFDANEAQRLGLVHQVASHSVMEARVTALIDALHSGGPMAQATAKQLIARIAAPIDADLIADTAAIIAAQRASTEGREGLKAFFEKRKPDWVES